MDDAKNTILSMKCARIIELLSVRFDGCLEKALDVLFRYLAINSRRSC